MPTPEQEPRRPSYQELLAAYERARETWERNPGQHTLAVLETGLRFLVQELQRPGKFELGQMVMTPGADEAMRTAGHIPPEFLLRHKHGDWGELPPEDVRENEWSLQNGARLFSAYQTRTDEKLWVITEWDRSVTTLLLPEEYCERVAKPPPSNLDHPDVLDMGKRGCSLPLSAPAASVRVERESKRSQAMRRILLACVLLGLVVTLGFLTVASVPAAQEATPSGEAAPVTAETLASAPAADAPGMALVLLRVTLAPGAVVPAHVHPGQLLVNVESGTFAYTILGGGGQTLRAAAGTPTAAEAIAPGTEVTLGPGEWFVEDAEVVHMDRNPGTEPAVILVTGLVAADQPFLQPMDMAMATPAA